MKSNAIKSYECDPAVAQKMFGCDPNKILAYVAASGNYQRNGALSCVASMLSDVQYLIAAGEDESARQQINVAKMVLFEVIDGNLFGVIERNAA